MKITTFFIALILSATILNAQSLMVYNVDTTAHPVLKANFFAFDEDYKQLLGLSLSDFEIYEDGVKREVLSVSCPEPVPPMAISSVLTMDISGSMIGVMLDKAQEAARSWVNALPLGKSECAITCFDDKNNIIQDFTKDRNRLLEKIELLGAGGGTDYEAGFINPLAGGLLVAQTGKYKKVLVFLTDGRPNFTPDVSKIVAEANKYNITIFAVTLDMPCPKCLFDISSQTGGACFENVSSVNEAREIYMKILQSAQGNGPCEIEWKTGLKCNSQNTELEVHLLTQGITATKYYQFPVEYLAELKFDPRYIYFFDKKPGIQHDTDLTVRARNSDFNVSSITSTNPDFKVSPQSFSIKNGASKTLTISYTPSDSGFAYTELDLINDVCETKIYSGGGFVGHTASSQTLKLTHPNGGEIFVVGSDTVITWEGIPPAEKVLLEYSTDNGMTWKIICDTASGLSYTWNKIPGPPSDECLVRVRQLQYGSNNLIPEIEWQKCLGGNYQDDAMSIEQTYDGGYIVAGGALSTDGDVIGHSGGHYDCWIVKLDPLGGIQWQSTLGGSGRDIPYSILQTTDSSYIFVAEAKSSDGDVGKSIGNGDLWIVKLDKIGKIKWKKVYGSGGWDKAASVKQTKDGGFIVAGHGNEGGDIIGTKGKRDLVVLKFDSIGNILWEKIIGGSGHEQSYSILETRSGDYVISGTTESNDGDIYDKSDNSIDILLVKLNSTGDIVWTKTYGGSETDESRAIRETWDGGFIIAGYSLSSDADVGNNYGETDLWIIKTDPDGNIQWEHNYGGTGDDWHPSIQLTYDYGYIVTCVSRSTDMDISGNKGGMDFFVLKLDIMGNIQWQKNLGGSKDDWPFSIQQTSDNGFIVAGRTRSNDGDVTGFHNNADFWIVKLSPEGTILQEDISDSVFSIVEPVITATDIDMGKVLIGKIKDSVVTNFITNIGSWECRIDSIYFRGADANAFALVSGIPQYIISSGASHHAEFGFRPTKAGLHQAEIVIISQSDTLIKNIRGEGVEPKLAVLCDWIDFGQVYLSKHKDTVKAIIENTGTASIEITKTEITGPDIDQFEIINGGGSFTLDPGDERELTLRFNPEYLGKTSTNLKFYHKEAGSPAITQLYGEGIRKVSDCDSTGFEYPDFVGVDDILLPGSAGRVDDFIRLTYANMSQAGAIWHEKPVPVGNGFITEFSFTMSSGNNVDTDDGSIPGADGLAFLIQNNSNNQLGTDGGGIGYHGIENSLAVEFDFFKNDNTQIINFKDPNGNHVAIQKSNDNKISALHNLNNTVGINAEIPELKSDGTVYYARIEYNIEPNVMSVYLDDSGELTEPVVVAGDVDLSGVVNLKESQTAFVGITSATGNAYQIHDLLDWYFCPFQVDITAVDSKVSSDVITFNIYPNPVSEKATIEINNPEYQYIELSITDIFGREVKRLYSGYKAAGNITFNWNTNGIGDAVYFCRLSIGGENFVKEIVVSM